MEKKRIVNLRGRPKIVPITNNNYREIKPETNSPDGFQRIEYALPAMLLCAAAEKIDLFRSKYHFDLVKDLTMRHAREN